MDVTMDVGAMSEEVDRFWSFDVVPPPNGIGEDEARSVVEEIVGKEEDSWFVFCKRQDAWMGDDVGAYRGNRR